MDLSSSRPLISSSALRTALSSDKIVLFDCGFDLANPDAGRTAYESAHIPSAIYLHLDEDLSAPAGPKGRHPLPDIDRFAAVMRKAGVTPDTLVVAYDAAGGPYAARLWWLLRWLGHQRVSVLDGGFQAWIAAGGETEAGSSSSTAAGDFQPREQAGLVATSEDVMANLIDPSFLVVDARSPERFRGDANTLDPVPGHIPGAVNRFFKDNLAEDGGFKPGRDLCAAFDAVTGGRPTSELVLQCGSGVTACHNALALAIAGRDGARLYPGSWSEWIADPARPVERS